MRNPFRGSEPPKKEKQRIHPVGMILMGIGLITVLYFMITYVLMPILAMMTVS